MIDTHSHIYSQEFDTDRAEVIQRAKEAGIQHIILPNVDSETLPRMLSLETEYPGYCFAAIGLHPTSVKENYLSELELVELELKRRDWIAIGEIGIDLYWDKTFLNEQIESFQQQVKWALEYELPIIIHVRNSFKETMEALTPFKNKGLRGVFHSFVGTIEEVQEILAFGGFKLGINGIITFKNSHLPSIISSIGLENILLETDSPYLTPVPYRGKRNESSYLMYVCNQISAILKLSKSEIMKETTKNAKIIFKLNI